MGNNPLEFIFGDLLDTFTANETKVLAALTHFNTAMEVKFLAELANLHEAAAQGALGDFSGRALVLPDVEERHFALVPMVADFLRRKRPEVVAETGNRLEERAYALIVENGYEKHDRFPVLDAAWPTVVPALPLFLAGPNERLQTVCGALRFFLEFTGRWDEWLSFEQQAEGKAMAAGDHSNAGWRAFQGGWVHYLRQQAADEVLACADRALAHWQTAQAGARERATAIRLRGIGLRLKGDYPAAIAAHRESLDLHRSLSPESIGVACVLNSLGEAERYSGDLVAAERDYREALRIARAATVGHSPRRWCGRGRSLRPCSTPGARWRSTPGLAGPTSKPPARRCGSASLDRLFGLRNSNRALGLGGYRVGPTMMSPWHWPESDRADAALAGRGGDGTQGPAWFAPVPSAPRIVNALSGFAGRSRFRSLCEG